MPREEHTKPQARGKIVFSTSDFTLNLSRSNLGVFISILASLYDPMKEEQAVKSKRYERQHRVDQARERLQDDQYGTSYEAFHARDDDNGRSVDADEVYQSF